MFTDQQLAYVTSQRLGRLATVSADGTPHVVPVGFRYNAELGTIDIGGHSLEKTGKFRRIRRQPSVALVVDDLASVNPWIARGVEVWGRAEALDRGGEVLGPGFGPGLIRITPTRVHAWGLDQVPVGAD